MLRNYQTYIKEQSSESLDEFELKVGDTVVVHDCPMGECPSFRSIKTDLNGEIGRIVFIRRISHDTKLCLVEFINNINGHEGSSDAAKIENGHGWYLNSNYLKNNNFNYKKIKKPELDPYDEDDWGYVMTESNAHKTIIYINKIVDKSLSINNIKRELDIKLLGKYCEWRTRRKDMTGVIIKIDVSKNFRRSDKDFTVYLNEDTVDQSYPVYVIEDNVTRKIEIVGYPSGEVFYVSPEELTKLTNLKLVKFSRYFSVRGISIENLYFFRDENVNDIVNYIEIYRRKHRQDIDLEDHEIDDFYHIKQLYRDKGGKITYEKKLIYNKK